MRKSAAVTVGMVLVAAMSFACSDGEEYVDADNQEICVDQSTDQRVDDKYCDDDGGHGGYHYWYHSSSHGSAPAVGSKINRSYGSFARPVNGSIARPPATGGFGRTVTSGGS